MSPEVEFMTT